MVLRDIISSCHGAFVKGHKILDVFLVAIQVVEEYRDKYEFIFYASFEKLVILWCGVFGILPLKRKGFEKR